MTIHLYTVTSNSGSILPFFYRHYDHIVDKYFIYDFGSTDETAEICTSHHNTSFQTVPKGNTEQSFRTATSLMNTAWQHSIGKADWVIICSPEEHFFIESPVSRFEWYQYFKAYLAKSAETGTTVIPGIGMDMVSNEFPNENTLLCKSIQSGQRVELQIKAIMFKPEAIQVLNLGKDGHTALPEGQAVYPVSREFRVLHFVYLGPKYAGSLDQEARVSGADLNDRWDPTHTYIDRYHALIRETRDMVIHLYTVTCNAEKILPYFFRHYDRLVDRYFVYDMQSSDRTPEMIESHERAVLKPIPNEITSARALLDQAWKESIGHADWIIICAVDEHFFVIPPTPTLSWDQYFKAYLTSNTRQGNTVIPARAFQMFTDMFPEDTDLLCDTIKTGEPAKVFARAIIFNPQEISDLNLGADGHTAIPVGNARYPVIQYPSRDTQPNPLKRDLRLLRFFFLGKDYVHIMASGKNLPSADLSDPWCSALPTETMPGEFERLIRNYRRIPQTTTPPTLPKSFVIHLYSLTLNEELMLPYFFRHYDSIVDQYFIFDNHSTDRTLEIIADNPKAVVEDITYPGGSFVKAATAFFNQVWKRSRGIADWVIISNVDEHMYIPAPDPSMDWDVYFRIYLQQCTAAGVTLVPARGFQMFSDDFPDHTERLCDTITTGVPWQPMNKTLILNPNAVDEINFGMGGHSAYPTGNVIQPIVRNMMLLHYKYLGFKYLDGRHILLQGGLKEQDLSEDLGKEYGWSEEDRLSSYGWIKHNATRIISE